MPGLSRVQAAPLVSADTLGAPAFCAACDGPSPMTDDGMCSHDGTALIPVAEEEDLTGTRLDERFDIGERLGRGGMGVVYRARQISVDREVAVKVLRPTLASDVTSVKRFLKEARAATRLNHPNTITVYDSGRSRCGRLYIAMELLGGESLFETLHRCGGLPPARAVHIAMQICDSLADAHDKGIIHRDLKPDNIHLGDRPGQEDFVTVLDFGIAKILSPEESQITRTGAVCGTAAYLAPEAAMGAAVDHRADLYSLGIMLYEILAGTRPFAGESLLDFAMQHVHAVPPSVSGVAAYPIPAQLDRLVSQLLEKAPANRPESIGVVRSTLLAIQSNFSHFAIEAVAVPPSGPTLSPLDGHAQTFDVGLRVSPPDTDDEGDPQWAPLPSDTIAAPAGADLWEPRDQHTALASVGRRSGRYLMGAAVLLTIAALAGWAFSATPQTSPPPNHAEAPVTAPEQQVTANPTAVPTTAASVVQRPRRPGLEADGLVRQTIEAQGSAPVHSVELTVQGGPASLWENGKSLGKTPATIQLAGDQNQRQLSVRRRGAVNQDVFVTVDTPGAVELTLQPAKKRDKPRPKSGGLLPFESEN